MKLTTAGRSGLLAAAMLLVGCSQPDEAQPTAPPTSGSAASSSAAGPSSVAGSTSGEASSADGVSSAGAVPSEAAPSESLPSESLPSETQPPASSSTAPVSSPAPVPSQAPSPASFPDPSEVEAQGFATNPLCEVLSVDEVGALLGAPVRPAIDAAEGTGCLWTGSAEQGSFLQLQMVGDPARYIQPAGAEILGDIGDAAFVVRDATGWTAQAQNPDGTFAVQLAGPTAGRDGTVEGLRRLVERY